MIRYDDKHFSLTVDAGGYEHLMNSATTANLLLEHFPGGSLLPRVLQVDVSKSVHVPKYTSAIIWWRGRRRPTLVTLSLERANAP